MLKNYLLVAIRNLKRQFSYSVISMTGLATGLATCLLLVMWIGHELSYDRFHVNADNIYRVSMEYSFGGQVAKLSVSPNALLPALLEMPETRTGARIYNASLHNPVIVKYGNNTFEENRFYFADSTFFDIPYKTPVGILPFVAAALVCIVIACASTAYQAIKASMINPATTLRNE